MLHLAAAVDRPTGYDAASYVDLAQLAEHGGFDFVTLHDTFARPGPDALAVLSGIAPATRRIGLVPTVTTTHTERFQAQAAVAALDRISGGRAGWRLDMSATEDEARLLGSRHPAPLGLARAGGPASRADALGQKAGEVAAAAAALWDSREDEAGPQDVPRGRPADRHTPYPVGFRDAAFFAQGPSTGPRPPQRHPVRVADATDAAAWQTAARYADVVLVHAASAAQTAAARDQLRAQAAGFGRDPDELRVLASLLVDLGDGEYAAEPGHGGGGPRQTERGPLYRGGPVDLAELIATWYAEGVVDGFHLTPTEPFRDLERLVNGTVALLRHRGLFRTFYPGGTLREHLGLTGPARQ
ncbi:LLM class flavin-dependent oxidoreductase [Streptomyces sp. NBC_00285]|uniref:LLM class flavin-dependent oxidoreductase n=1 Tax=Streptomyces sp. NBC_00285 TaxID=2975700 RepID=UPI002E28CF86|nr:LLM class flavin-dependent oxidoreductase [Streptomyces sp. NBC_00285]